MKKLRNFFVLLLLVLGVTDCKENPVDPPITQPILPTVVTNSVNFTSTTATTGGEVISDGNSQVTVRGVVWDTNPNPTISNNKTVDGTGTGKYVSNISGLNPNTVYYIRAYAINSVGTSYGQTVNFVTSNLQIGDSYWGWAIFCLEPLLGFKVVQEYQNWEKAMKTATSMGEHLSSVSQQLILYSLKDKFGLTEFTYWSFEEKKDNPSFVVSVIFNSPSRPETNGQLVYNSKLFITLKPLVVHEF